MDFDVGLTGCRIVGDYIIGPKIGSGSFAVVWKSKHRVLGTIFAIKEIDKKHLNDNLRKEITILRNISHPNIIRLFEAIETEERIYLVLEYCKGGDLGAYINRYGRVSEDIARHFLKQLAAGLQVLRENNLIHRDLKPQNLLLSDREVTPLLKIGDFGFARYLTPQDLAATLCGSPLYMAPEIIQNQRYDAKADLWSVGAICYQLVIGRPPFDGDSQKKLFENILKSTELRFPEGALQHLQPDYVEFCRSLLRRNPVERLTFEEFFNHRFLMGTRAAINVESSSQISQVEPLATDDQVPQSEGTKEVKAPKECVEPVCSIDDLKREFGKGHCSTSRGRDVYGIMPNNYVDRSRHSVVDDGSGPYSSQTRVAYSLDAIEREYVLVHSNFASMEILTSSLGTSLKEGVATKACDLAPKNNDKQLPTMPEMKELTAKFVSGFDNLLSSESAIGEPSTSREGEGLPMLHPSARLQLIHQYVSALSDLAREKFNAGCFLESFSVELVVLALWKEALRICEFWLIDSGLPKISSGNKSVRERAASSSKTENTLDFTNPSTVSIWAEQGFINAYDGTEKLSKYLHELDGAAEMPDAMEIVFQTAIAAGKYGAADELIGNCESAAVMYTKALHFFSFIVGEAPLLPLNPPFSLSPDGKQRILKYMKSLEYHLSNSQSSQPPSMKQLPNFVTK